MKRLMISAVAVVAMLAAATTVLRSQSSATSFAARTGMISVQELHAAAGSKGLPIEEFEDQSLVYSAAPKH